ncbi:SusD/RagB family nutrient-binding outer membrane lipoprotein [Sphingobacterium sp. KB22]|uniref:SusD/RagB family nutrient-binding outer membrane lipoprotein n=2 Tax=Sphingobacterium hungaricum TaxID=2082723 RepID=A0A928UUD0_9SPHI|nr:SusD/RagB family nutrient-binding outer membrane lipoprotein [Sphingobacterium hungaricum]
MKKLFSIVVIASALTMSSCDKWLDVNDNPNNPNTKVPTVDLRLPSIIARFAEGYESGGTRAALISQQIAGTTANNWNLARWNITTAAVNWPYQPWYIYTANNIPDLIEKGEETGAYHYIGAGKIIWAWGFTAFSDLYGMLPYEEAFVGGNMTPKYDQGDLVYEKCLVILDEAIAELQKTQNPSAPLLAKGDYLYDGDPQKWIKLAYGIKARLLNHLSKTDRYDAQAILDLLDKAPKTALESALYQYQDRAESNSLVTESLQFQNNTSNRLTTVYINYILNNYTGAPTGGANMEDPRADLLIPRFLPSNVRTPGVDMNEIPDAGFGSTISLYAGLRPVAGVSTGSTYVDAGAKGLLLTSAEMHFIKAEVLFNQNNKTAALAAYKDGIKDHMEILEVPSASITQFLASTSVVQDANALTLSQIMIQKYIALSYSPEVFNDVRRLEYCSDATGKYNEATGIYKGLKRPKAVFTLALPTDDVWPRRFAVASYGINYNLQSIIASDADAISATYTTKRIWWDVKK